MFLHSRKIIVLGEGGMLGQMAVSYFTPKCQKLITIPFRYEPDTRHKFIEEIRKYPGSVIINAIGKIKQKSEAVQELLWANAILPLDLANGLLKDQVLIHPSTDCVFSGVKSKPYAVTDTPDATDDYGWSKRLGEVALVGRPNTMILRVSIIGPDLSDNPKGLFGWFLAQPKKSRLQGYVNHLWNGITTLEWCKQTEKQLELFDENAESCRLIQLGIAKYYTKYELLKLFQNVFATDYEINAFSTVGAVDRRLKPDVVCKPLREQMRELKMHGYGSHPHKSN